MKTKWILLVLLMLMICTCIGYSGMLTNFSYRAGSHVAGATTTYTFNYTTATALSPGLSSGDAILYVYFPEGFTVGGATTASVTVNGVSKTIGLYYQGGATNVAYIEMVESVSAGSSVVVVLSVKNQASAGSYSFLFIRTASGAGYEIDAPASIDPIVIAGSYALKFAGGTDSAYVAIPNSSVSGIKKNMTIEAWVNISSSSMTGRIVDHLTAGYNDGFLFDILGGHPRFIFGNYSITGSSALSANTWHHIAATTDTTTNLLTLYVNGSNIGTASASGTLPTNSYKVRIGIDQSGGSRFSGIIDEVRIWSVARTPAQIQSAMNTDLTGSENGLVGYWNLNEGTGSIAYDLAGTNDGTLTNFLFDGSDGWVSDSLSSLSTATEVATSLPRVFTLNQNYPNPFNPTTTISFTLAKDGFTTLKVYDILGREVATLVSGAMKAGVVNTATWNAAKLASGVYFSRLESNGSVQMKKLMLLK